MAYKDRDEFLDAFWDHLTGGEEPDEEFGSWFDEKVASFFGDDGPGGNAGNTHPRRARQTGGNENEKPKRTMPPRRRSRASSGYGASSWWGSGE